VTSTLLWIAAGVVLAALAFAGVRFLAARRGPRHGLADVADGRHILIARGRRVTEQLSELADEVAEREDDTASRLHAQAVEVVTAVRGRVGRSSTMRVQARAHQDLDEAEWLIGGVRARLDGFVEPMHVRKGLPATCFFNGDHGLATVEIDLGGIALQRIPVRTCAACAVSLVRGEHPGIGSVELGGRRIPWPAVPRWCGSYGWALRDLRHLHYDGEPLFEAPERTARRVPRSGDGPRGRPRVLPVEPEIPDTVDEAVGDVPGAPMPESAPEPTVERAPEPVAAEPASAPDAQAEAEGATEADPTPAETRPPPGGEVPERALSSAFAAIQSDPPAPHERHPARDEPQPE
jgi:hypothetical protein